jgi:hypothetical protein
MPERFYSLPGSSMPAAGAAESAGADSAMLQSGLQEQQQQQQQRAAEPRGEEQQDSEYEQFEDVGDSSLYATSSAAVSAAEDIDAASVTGSSGGDKQLQQQQQLPFSEDQLQELIAGSLKRQYWEPIHDGVGSVRDVYSIRGPNYLKDRKKMPAGATLHIRCVQICSVQCFTDWWIELLDVSRACRQLISAWSRVSGCSMTLEKYMDVHPYAQLVLAHHPPSGIVAVCYPFFRAWALQADGCRPRGHAQHDGPHRALPAERALQRRRIQLCGQPHHQLRQPGAAPSHGEAVVYQQVAGASAVSASVAP